MALLFPFVLFRARMYKAFISNTSGFCDAGSFVLEGERRIFGHLQHRWIADLVSHPTVMDAVRSLIGPNVLAKRNGTWKKKCTVCATGDGLSFQVN